MARAASWRGALVRKLKAGEGSFGGDHAEGDRKAAIEWLQTGRNVRFHGPDFKVVVRPISHVPDWGLFRYKLCVGSLGYSASDYNDVVSVVEGKDF